MKSPGTAGASFVETKSNGDSLSASFSATTVRHATSDSGPPTNDGAPRQREWPLSSGQRW
jgi:hypothetical protein